MPEAPSIKGSALSAVVEDVRALRDRRELSPTKLRSCLEPEDFALIDGGCQPALWYPMTSYRRLTQLLLDTEGDGDPEYIARRGARAAERLWEAGIYLQLVHGSEKADQARAEGGVVSERDARIMTTLSGSIFNFTRWSFRLEDGECLIEVCEAEELPELAVYAARGFIEYVVGRTRGSATKVRARRPARERVEFRFDR